MVFLASQWVRYGGMLLVCYVSPYLNAYSSSFCNGIRFDWKSCNGYMPCRNPSPKKGQTLICSVAQYVFTDPRNMTSTWDVLEFSIYKVIRWTIYRSSFTWNVATVWCFNYYLPLYLLPGWEQVGVPRSSCVLLYVLSLHCFTFLSVL